MALSKIDEAGWGGTQVGGRRNLIINGAMQVAQRGDQTGVTNGYACDRFNVVEETSAGVIDANQSTESPDGFASSLHVDVTTADTSIAAGDIAYLRYKFEGQDLQGLSYGTSSAQSMTLSFWVRSSVTGTYAFNLYSNDEAKINRHTYTIDTADTWEKKTITITGDTSDGFGNDNNVSLSLHWVLVAGTTYTGGTLAANTWDTYDNTNFGQGHAVNVLSSASNNFYLTGVQLEVGNVATPFEHRSYGEELAACMRYCYVFGTGTTNNAALGTGFAYQTTWAFASIHFPVEMRSTPSLSNVGGSWEWSDWHVSGFATGTLSFGDGTRQGGRVFSAGTVSGLTDYRDYFLQRAGGSPTLTFDAEL